MAMECDATQNWRRTRPVSAALIVALIVTLATGLSPAGVVHAADAIEVKTIVLAETALRHGQEQLAQVTLRNTVDRPMQIGVRAEMLDAQDRRVGAPRDVLVEIAAKDESQEFFRFPSPRWKGKFTVRVELFTPDFKEKLLTGTPAFLAPFTVLNGPEMPAAAQAQTAAMLPSGGRSRGLRVGPPSFAPPSGLRFDQPDLLWENVRLANAQALSGEPLKVMADLRNVGGDVARGVEVKVEYFNTRSTGRRIPVNQTSVLALAPGEKVEMEFEAAITEDAPNEEYQIALAIDPEGKLDEANRQNNALVLPSRISFRRIKLIFPDPDYVFEDSGLFLFRWDSRRFDEFKVQVGTNPEFDTQGTYFDLPQGAKWSTSRELVPLEGELPGMAEGLMERAKTDKLYWRVQARDSKTGKTGTSAALPFMIRLAKKDAGQGAGAEPRSSAPPAKGRTAAPPPMSSPDSEPDPAAAPEAEAAPQDTAPAAPLAQPPR